VGETGADGGAFGQAAFGANVKNVLIFPMERHAILHGIGAYGGINAKTSRV
jgi:hypothetical protein